MTAVVQQVLALSDERDQWQQRLLQAELAAYNDGYADGRRDEKREADQEWAAQPARRPRHGPPFAELEQRRHNLRGEQRTRETFGQPHPDDYQGSRQ